MSGMRGQKYERLFESDEEAPPHEQVKLSYTCDSTDLSVTECKFEQLREIN